MANVFTPGLKVTAGTVIERVRRLPIQGDVQVNEGDVVSAEQIVARADLPGRVHPLNVAGLLGCDPAEVPELMLFKEGDSIELKQKIAETSGFFGFFKSQCQSPIEGLIESISKVTGQVMLREHPIPVTVSAYINGRVVEVLAGDGVVVRSHAAWVQGIFGLGGERFGEITMLGQGDEIGADAINAEHKDKILVGAGRLTLEGYKKAMEVEAAAVVCGGYNYSDIREVLGYDIGVAITGTEPVATTLVVTEGFGKIHMAQATWDLLSSHAGQKASVNGATQIRAGVIRPEVVVPLEDAEKAEAQAKEEPKGIEVGGMIRVIRHPYFGRIGKVTGLPVELQKMASETMVRVIEVELDDGEQAVLPRANVERIEL